MNQNYVKEDGHHLRKHILDKYFCRCSYHLKLAARNLNAFPFRPFSTTDGKKHKVSVMSEKCTK
jgi:hypothetical protein